MRIRILAVSAILILGLACGCGGTGGGPNFVSAVAPCACTMTAQPDSWIKIGTGPQMAVTQGCMTQESTGATSAKVCSQFITTDGSPGGINANLYAKILQPKKIFVDDGTIATYAGIDYSVNSGQGLTVAPNYTDPKQISGNNVNTNKGQISFQFTQN